MYQRPAKLISNFDSCMKPSLFWIFTLCDILWDKKHNFIKRSWLNCAPDLKKTQWLPFKVLLEQIMQKKDVLIYLFFPLHPKWQLCHKLCKSINKESNHLILSFQNCCSQLSMIKRRYLYSQWVQIKEAEEKNSNN